VFFHAINDEDLLGPFGFFESEAELFFYGVNE